MEFIQHENRELVDDKGRTTYFFTVIGPHKIPLF